MSTLTSQTKSKLGWSVDEQVSSLNEFTVDCYCLTGLPDWLARSDVNQCLSHCGHAAPRLFAAHLSIMELGFIYNHFLFSITTYWIFLFNVLTEQTFLLFQVIYIIYTPILTISLNFIEFYTRQYLSNSTLWFWEPSFVSVNDSRHWRHAKISWDTKVTEYVETMPYSVIIFWGKKLRKILLFKYISSNQKFEKIILPNGFLSQEFGRNHIIVLPLLSSYIWRKDNFWDDFLILEHFKR